MTHCSAHRSHPSTPPPGLAPADKNEFRLMQEKELSHGRLGMIAAAGFLAQEAVTGDTWGAYWGDASF